MVEKSTLLIVTLLEVKNHIRALKGKDNTMWQCYNNVLKIEKLEIEHLKNK